VLLILVGIMYFFGSWVDDDYYATVKRDARRFVDYVDAHRQAHGKLPTEGEQEAWLQERKNRESKLANSFSITQRDGQSYREGLSTGGYLIADWNGEFFEYYDPQTDTLYIDYSDTVLNGGKVENLTTDGYVFYHILALAAGWVAFGLLVRWVGRKIRRAGENPPRTSNLPGSRDGEGNQR